MPTYPYACSQCDYTFDVIKSVRQIEDPETCPKCRAASKRYLVAVNFNGASDWDKAEYNPGLGQVVKSRRDAEKIAAQRGLIPVGNENVDKIIATQEKNLAAEQESRSEKALEGVVYGMNKVLKGEKL